MASIPQMDLKQVKPQIGLCTLPSFNTPYSTDGFEIMLCTKIAHSMMVGNDPYSTIGFEGPRPVRRPFPASKNALFTIPQMDLEI